MKIIGIDPGNSGCITVLDGEIVSHCRLDMSDRDVSDFLAMHQGFAYLENVHSMPGQGVSSSFKFGQSFGFLRGLLVAHWIPFDLVQPAKWQTAMGCARPKGEKKESQTEHKNRTKRRAQELFPEITITHAIADSLLIAEYGRRIRAGELSK